MTRSGQIALMLIVCAFPLSSQQPGEGRDTPRSMVASTYGIVATNHPLASRAGTMILEHGGTAVDAAIAADAVLGVVEPVLGGIGGDLFALVYEAKTKKVYGINASGWTPSGQTIEFMKKKGITAGRLQGADAVNVPGAVAGWDQLRKRFGKLPFSATLRPATRIAQEGFPISEQIGGAFQSKFAQSFRKVPGYVDTYMPGGNSPKAGDIFRNAALARSLTLIAQQGRDAFYKGPIASAIIPFLQRLGSAVTVEDFAVYDAEWQDPISTTYRGWTVYQLPPNGPGSSTLALLNMMEPSPLAEYGHNTARTLHLLIEAKKLATSDLLEYVGDPRHTKNPIEVLTSKEFAVRRAAQISQERADCAVAPAEAADVLKRVGQHTTYLTAVDHDGNMISLIRSNAQGFGTGLVAPGTGFSLQNRSAGFVLEPGRPNSLAGRKRPLHTITPGFMQKGDVRISFGFAGGITQPASQVQFISNVADFGMNIQQALAAPRFGKIAVGGCSIDVESRILETVRVKLAQWGHELQIVGDYGGGVVGIGNAVLRDGRGVNFGASDPRWDGDAIPQMPPVFGTPQLR